VKNNLRVVVDNQRMLRTEAESRIAREDRERMARLRRPPPCEKDAREARRFFFVVLGLFVVFSLAWFVSEFRS
jgi:hypothetical protein